MEMYLYFMLVMALFHFFLIFKSAIFSIFNIQIEVNPLVNVFNISIGLIGVILLSFLYFI